MPLSPLFAEPENVGVGNTSGRSYNRSNVTTTTIADKSPTFCLDVTSKTHSRRNISISYVPSSNEESSSGVSEVLNPSCSHYFGKSVRQSEHVLHSIGSTRLHFNQQIDDQPNNDSGNFDQPNNSMVICLKITHNSGTV